MRLSSKKLPPLAQIRGHLKKSHWNLPKKGRYLLGVYKDTFRPSRRHPITRGGSELDPSHNPEDFARSLKDFCDLLIQNQMAHLVKPLLRRFSKELMNRGSPRNRSHLLSLGLGITSYPRIRLAQEFCRILFDLGHEPLARKLNQYFKSLFVTQAPEDLEFYLRNYKPIGPNLIFWANIRPEELLRHFVGYIPEVYAPGILSLVKEGREGVYFNPTPKLYFYFPPPEGKKVDIPLAIHEEFRLALNLDLFGFPSKPLVSINPMDIDFELSQDGMKRYRDLICRREIPALELMEAIGFMVNDSFEVNYDQLGWLAKRMGTTVQALKEKYPPTGREVHKGVCGDSGKQIRMILASLQIEERFRWTYVQSDNGICSHDTTVLFDVQTGEWGIINSKSDFKPYNVVPKGKLAELGRPYV